MRYISIFIFNYNCLNVNFMIIETYICLFGITVDYIFYVYTIYIYILWWNIQLLGDGYVISKYCE